ncbi:MAG: ABC transporter substrate-binding protein [Alphaproteobacteria bacterium]
MKRRNFLKLMGAGAAVAGMRPMYVSAQSGKTLRYIASSDLAILDPVASTAYSTRNHAFMVYDTLYGLDSSFKPSPQMLEGHEVDKDGKSWTLKLRDGLFWHDGEKVLARDCVASIERWGKKDVLGSALMASTDKLSATDDRTIQFKLKKPFPLLPDALAKVASPICVMMPERLAKTDPGQAVTEVVGSGPFRYIQDARVPGALNVYRKFDKYKPRSDGKSDWTAGPKVVYFDEVRWTTITDIATATAALQNGEQDWLEIVNADMLTLVRKAKGVTTKVLDVSGEMTMLQINHLQPPFNNVAIRRAFWGAINQKELMQAVVGANDSLYQVPLGYFAPNSPMANNAGIEVLAKPSDLNKVKADLASAGYKGEKVVLIVAAENPTYKALGDVLADTMRKVGMNVDYVATDLATLFARRKSKDSSDQGGWSAFVTAWGGLDWLNPAVHVTLRSNGPDAYAGWADIPKIVQLRERWFDAPDVAAQKKICEEIQAAAFESVPFYPLGKYLKSTAYRDNITNVGSGFPMFWGVRPS